MKKENKKKLKTVRKCAAKSCANFARLHGRKNLCWAHLNRLRRKGNLGDSPIKRVTKHGMSKTKVYAVWSGMLARCLNTKVDSYKYYGGRGLSVSKAWLMFNKFYKDMGEPPSDSHSIDRIDNSKGYSKNNCRWACVLEQANNKRRSVILEYRGEKHPAYIWEQKTGLRRKTLVERHRKGWREDKLFSPLNPFGLGVSRRKLKRAREALAMKRLIG